MKTRNDFARQASLYTMNGLIDPRILAGYEKTTASASSPIQFSLPNNLKRLMENIVVRIKNEPAKVNR
ncbi:MAG TPA: hypothetical protein PLJ60_13315 [Chryseolinea sp.]|nr:hypothetical protein [Chryseolinea sp.]